MKAVLAESQLQKARGKSITDMLNLLENPFSGLETTWKQSRYFKRKGVLIEPHTFPIDTFIYQVDGKSSAFRHKLLTGEYVSQKLVFEKFLSLPGVLNGILSYMKSAEPENDMLCDFKDGILWKHHPVRILHMDKPNTVVIPVFDFYDDLETANPLGSHAVIHKIGAKYTVVKALKPMLNSKLENIFLNMLINSKDRKHKGVFDIYLDEMKRLETEGFELIVEGVRYRIYVLSKLLGITWASMVCWVMLKVLLHISYVVFVNCHVKSIVVRFSKFQACSEQNRVMLMI